MSVSKFYILFQVFFALIWWVPIFYEFQIRIGLSESEIFHIQSIYYLSFVLLEVPTGWFSDRFSERRTLLLAAVIFVFSNLIAIKFSSKEFFLLHFLLIALARSLVSGSASSFLYRYLVLNGKEDSYKDVEASARSYGLATKILAFFLAGYLMNTWLKLPYVLTACSGLVAMSCAYFLPKLPAVISEKKPNTSIRKRIINEFVSPFSAFAEYQRKHPYLVFIMLQGSIIFIFQRIALVNLYQPILISKSFGVVSFGYILAASTAGESLGARLSTKWFKGKNDMWVVCWTGSLSLLAFGLLSISNQMSTVALMVMFCFFIGLSFPSQKKLMNDAIPLGGQRATILSVESLIQRLGCSVLAWLLGGIVEKKLMNEFIFIAAILSISAIIVLTFLIKKLVDHSQNLHGRI